MLLGEFGVMLIFVGLLLVVNLLMKMDLSLRNWLNLFCNLVFILMWVFMVVMEEVLILRVLKVGMWMVRKV